MNRRTALGLAGSLLLLALVTSGCSGSRRGGIAEANAAPPASTSSKSATARGKRADRKVARAENVSPAPDASAVTAATESLPADSAEARWREALAREPADAGSLTRLSRLLYQQGRHAEALALLGPVREGQVKLSGQDRAAVLAGLAMHEAALGRDAEARALLAALPEDAAPGVTTYLAVRGVATDTALAATERALKTAPESAVLRNNRGIALLRAGDADAASAEFERAIALDPARPGPYYNLAILEHFYRLDTAAAQRWFKEYWSRSHADPDSLQGELGRTRPATVAEGSRER